jgi:hypothetical protein
MGNRALIGADRHIWGNSECPANHNNDLLGLGSPENDDVFSNWFSERLLVFYHIITQSRIRKHVDVEAGMCSYQDHSIQKCISYITMLIASLIPILAIVVLFCVGSMKARLGLVALFTIIFTMSLTILTSAKKAEIFAATSTYVLLNLPETFIDFS